MRLLGFQGIAVAQQLSILVVEDDPLAQKVMAANLREHRTDFAADAAAGRRLLDTNHYDLCFIDLKLGEKDDCSGLKLISQTKSKRIYSVVMSGHDTEDYVEQAYKLGCDDFYAKGNEESNVAQLLSRFLERSDQSRKEQLFGKRFITQDPETRSAIEEALTYASSNLPVLILGPSGTGKTSLARIIHDHSGRRGEFVAINCSAYTEELLEAELFGFRKGAFTGAHENRQGKLLAADRGTLFLDEIGAMSLKMQTKLLKAIEERSFYPLGSNKPETSDFRIISATLEDLQTLIKVGKLRFDFFQRIHGLTIRLKPLSQRTGDILPLIAFFTRGSRRLSFAADAKEKLLRHDWPGNIRELKKLVDLLTAGQEGRVTREVVWKILAAMRVQEGAPDFVTEAQYRFAAGRGLNEAVDLFIDTIIQRSLAENGGKKTAVLDHLKIATRLLYTSLARRGDHAEAKESAERPTQKEADHEAELNRIS